MRKSVASLFAVLSLVVVVAGCGAGSSTQTSDRSADGARAVMHEFVADLAAGKLDAACDLATPEGKADLGNGDASRCASGLAVALGVIGKPQLEDCQRKLAGARITVVGTTATVPSLGTGQSTKLLYAHGHWRVGAS